MVVQQGEQVPFLEEMMGHVSQDVSELEHLHVCTYFEAVGHMIGAAAPESKERLVARLTQLFNEKWCGILQALSADGAQTSLQSQQVLREISLILRVNERMVSAVGVACHSQLSNIYYDMLKIYKLCSDHISHSLAQQGTQVMGYAHIQLMRNVKRATLRLVQTFVDMVATDPGAAEAGLSVQQLAQRFIPPLLEPVLADYRSNLPQARDAEVLDLLATLAARLSESISREVANIFEMVFECTLDMIRGDFQSYPDHRTKFYDLLKAVNSHCFQALFYLPEPRLKLYVDSLIWALKHEQPAVAESGLQILQQFLERLLSGPPQVYVPFFKQYYFTLLQDILSVLTDTLHKGGFKLQQHILSQLVAAAEAGLLSEVATKQGVMEFLFDMIGKSFPTLHRSQVEIFVLHCFNKCRQAPEFQAHIRDFLIQLREWGSHEDALYEDERKDALAKAQAAEGQWRLQVPGLVPQYDPARAGLEAEMDDL